MKPWVTYSLIRAALFIGVFAAVFAIASAQGIEPFTSALIAGGVAAVVGWTVSYIFLSKQREAVALALYEARHPTADKTGDDENAEDAIADGPTGRP